MAWESLQELLTRLERADSDDNRVDSATLEEMRSPTRWLHENGFNVGTVRRGRNLVVEIEPVCRDQRAG
jgi:hypothetical protein